MPLAMFDLDRTLVRKDTAGLFMRYELQQKLTTPWRVAQVGWWRLLYTLGFADSERVARLVLGWYSGRDEAELRRHTALWFERVVVPLIAERGRRAVEEHRARGDALVIVTASTQFVAELLARELNIEHIVCTELLLRDGALSGEFAFPLCYGAGKLAKVRSLLDHKPNLAGDAETALAAATLYTDSITDLPLLEAVGHPVAVNPDPRLRAIAIARGWPVEAW
jgi:HAD superfamily hydrolase (TIGR01490 family)